MILEVAVLHVVPGQETAFARAVSILIATPGYISH